MLNKLKDQKGFNILEIVIVISIIALGLVGVISLVVKNLQLESINKHAIIANQLTQEGMELVRNARENNWLNNIDWQTNIVNDGTYTIDYLGNIDDTADSISDTAANLKIDSDGYYWHGSGTTTPYNRLITVTDQTDYLDIQCQVSWQEKNKTYYYDAQTYLYNWK